MTRPAPDSALYIGVTDRDWHEQLRSEQPDEVNFWKPGGTRAYLTVDPQHRVHVSRRVREEFENGCEYYRFDGAPLVNLPRPADERPERTYLTWHNEHVFEAGAERAEGRHMGGET